VLAQLTLKAGLRDTARVHCRRFQQHYGRLLGDSNNSGSTSAPVTNSSGEKRHNIDVFAESIAFGQTVMFTATITSTSAHLRWRNRHIQSGGRRSERNAEWGQSDLLDFALGVEQRR